MESKSNFLLETMMYSVVEGKNSTASVLIRHWVNKSLRKSFIVSWHRFCKTEEFWRSGVFCFFFHYVGEECWPKGPNGQSEMCWLWLHTIQSNSFSCTLICSEARFSADDLSDHVTLLQNRCRPKSMFLSPLNFQIYIHLCNEGFLHRSQRLVAEIEYEAQSCALKKSFENLGACSLTRFSLF